jgi:hypothetical protein
MALFLWDVLRHWSWPIVLQPDIDATSLIEEAAFLIPSLGGLISAVLAQREARSMQHDRVMIFENGLLLRQNRRKRQVDALRWEQIEEIFDDGLLTHVYVLRRRGGKELRLDIRYQHLEALIAEIRRQVSVSHRPTPEAPQK